jgi:hypothetical protein
MTRPLPGAAAGFPITLVEAARLLEMTPQSVVDLVRAGMLTACVTAAYQTLERPPLRFDEHNLATVRAAITDPEAASDAPELRPISETSAISAALRAHLTERAPADSSAAAVDEDRPLLCATRGGTVHAHVRAESVAERARALASPRTRLRLSMPHVTENALTRLGCQEVRGVRAVADSKQSWRTWWRVPLSIWSLAEEDMLRVDDFPALGGTRIEEQS